MPPASDTTTDASVIAEPSSNDSNSGGCTRRYPETIKIVMPASNTKNPSTAALKYSIFPCP